MKFIIGSLKKARSVRGLFIDRCLVSFLPFIPEQEEVATSLNIDLKKYTNKGHFMSFSFPDLLEEIKARIH